MNLCPARLEPIFSPRPWGAGSLAPFFPVKSGLAEPIGEAWMTGRRMPRSRTVPSRAALRDAWREMPPEWAGTRADVRPRFPLLVKFIFPEEKLSVQVHPDDAYAAAHEQAAGGRGKTEMWYAMRARPGAEVLVGLKPDVTRESFARAIADGTAEDCLLRVPVRTGDAIFVPAGTAHTIGPGMVLCEIQEQSDLTYRVFDYNRRDAQGRTRELHIEKALDVMRFGKQLGGKVEPVRIQEEGAEKTYFVSCRYFETCRWEFSGPVLMGSSAEYFDLLIFLEGSGTIRWQSEHVDFAPAQVWMIPAGLGAYQIAPGAGAPRCCGLSCRAKPANSVLDLGNAAFPKATGCGWCINEAREEKAREEPDVARLRGDAGRRAGHTILAAEPQAHSEAAAEYRRFADDGARNACAVGAGVFGEECVDRHEQGAVAGGAARAAGNSAVACAGGADGREYCRGDWAGRDSTDPRARRRVDGRAPFRLLMAAPTRPGIARWFDPHSILRARRGIWWFLAFLLRARKPGMAISSAAALHRIRAAWLRMPCDASPRSRRSRTRKNIWNPARISGTRECFSGVLPRSWRIWATFSQRLTPRSRSLENPSAPAAIRRRCTASIQSSRIFRLITRSWSRPRATIPHESSVFVIPAKVGWSDIGSWAAVYELLVAKPGANVSAGASFTLDSEGNYFWSGKKFVAAIGVRDLVVVETADALLICPRERSQDVGKIVKWLEENSGWFPPCLNPHKSSASKPRLAIKFGTDGWRGVMAEDFTFENVRIVAHAIGRYAARAEKPGAGIVVGYDMRFASERFARVAAETLAAGGTPVFLAQEPCPTPAVSLLVRQRAAAGGIQITASHNPSRWNGVKFKASYGSSASPAIVAQIEEGACDRAARRGACALPPRPDLIQAARCAHAVSGDAGRAGRLGPLACREVSFSDRPHARRGRRPAPGAFPSPRNRSGGDSRKPRSAFRRSESGTDRAACGSSSPSDPRGRLRRRVRARWRCRPHRRDGSRRHVRHAAPDFFDFALASGGNARSPATWRSHSR